MRNSTPRIAALALMMAAGTAIAADTTWQLVNPLPVELDLHDVAFANGLYVAVGERGVVLTSGDGVTWQRRVSPVVAGLRGVAWHAPLWVAVGAQGTVLTSRDGVHWRQRDPVGALELEAVASSPHGLVAVGREGVIVTSANGVRWTERSSPVTVALWDVAWVGEDWIAVGYGGAVLSSVDSVVWELQETGVLRGLRSVAGHGSVALIAGDGLLARRDAGSKWQSRFEPLLNGSSSVAWCGDRFVVVGATWASSTDGVYWDGGVGGGFTSVACGEPGVAAVGRHGLTAFGHDTHAWTETSGFTSKPLGAVVADGERAIAVAQDLILHTDDGASWQSMPSPGDLIRAAAGGGRFVVIHASFQFSSGAIYVSDDGIHWTRSWDEWGPDAITWDGERFVAVERRGVLTSRDGMDWQEHMPGPPFWWPVDVASDGQTIVATNGWDLTTAAAAGGEWVVRDPGVQRILAALAWGAGRFVAVGEFGAILSSADGHLWQQELSPTDANLWEVTYTGEGFAAVGTGGVVLESPDGRLWQRVETGLHGDLFGVARLGRGLIAVGDHGLIQRELVEDPDVAPTAAFTWRPTVPQVGMPVRFSDRSDGPPTDWRWLFGDGRRGDGREVVHAFDQPGAYSVTLWAGNDAGSSPAEAEITVEALCAVPQVPVLDGPGRAVGDEPYTIRWSDVGDVIYRIEECPDAAFAREVRAIETTDTGHAFSHSWLEGRRYYYRVRAEIPCWNGRTRSNWSSLVEVRIERVPASPEAHVVAVPASSAEGLGGSQWSTDVLIHNPGAEPATAALFLIGSDQEPGPALELVMEGGACLRLEDAPRMLAGGPASGAVLVGSDRELLVAGQVFSQRPDGRYGHAVPGLVGTQGSDYLPLPLWRNDELRTNVGALSFDDDEVIARLVALEDGRPVTTTSWTVAPHSHELVSDVVAAMGLERSDGDLGLVNIRVDAPNSSVNGATWVSAVDNRSGDAALWTPRPPSTRWRKVKTDKGDGSWALVVPEVRSGSGWRTDLVLLNAATGAGSVEVDLVTPQGGEAPVHLEVPARDSVVLHDVLASVLGLDGEAVLRITPSSRELEVTARTWAPAGDGSRGLRAHAFRDDELITHLEQGLLVVQRESDLTTTRIDLVNPRAAPVEVKVGSGNPEGGVVHELIFELQPFGRQRIVGVDYWGLHDDECIAVWLRTASPDGAFLAYAVITDTATGDEMLIPAVLRER